MFLIFSMSSYNYCKISFYMLADIVLLAKEVSWQPRASERWTQRLPWEILPFLTKEFVMKPIEGVQATPMHPTWDNSSQEMVENGGTLPLKHVL